MKRIPTVTVAVCAYNEEQNIKAFIRSVLAQKETGFRLESIRIISDGSTDRTVRIAQSISSRKIRIIRSAKRMGKSNHLNALYRSLKSDILVQSDADVVFAHPHVIRDSIKPLLHDSSIGLCGGNPVPLSGETLLEKAVNHTTIPYQHFRHAVRGGNNVFSADGRLLALRRTFAQTITVPSTMIANDMYAYFYCLVSGWGYRFVPDASVLYRSPQTIKDQIRQNTRFLAAHIRMERYFSKELVRRELAIPFSVRILALLKQFLKNPVLCLLAFGINRYCALRALLIEKRLTARWQLAYTTKRLYNVSV